MSIRTWVIDKLGGVPTEEIEARGGFEVYLEGLQGNIENARAAGVVVTPESALRLSAVYACVRVLGETMATLPLIMYERLANGGRQRVADQPLIQRLHDPNPFQTDFEYIELITNHLSLRGNSYNEVTTNERGQITELFPLPPQCIVDHRVDGDRRFYLFQDPVDGRRQWLSNIWHIRLMGDGFTGYSPLGMARRAAELGLSAEEFGYRFFENDARPGIVLEHPAKLSPRAEENLRTSFEAEHKGVSKSHKVKILEEGMKLHEVGIPPEDAQFLETRKFQVNEIARIYRIPPHMIGDLERSTNNNIEQQGIEFGKFTMLPWAKRIEASAKKHLMLERERKRYYLEFLMDGLERGDLASRYNAYAIGRQNGFLSANDIRRLENMDPVEGGEVYLVPLNMVPADQVGDLGNGGQPAQPGGVVDTARSSFDSGEQRSRATSAALQRHRLMQAYLRLYTDVAGRIVRREANDVGAAARKFLGQKSNAEFLMWLDNFYQEHADFIEKNMRPLAMTYGELVAAAAQEEIGIDPGMTNELERFINRYVTAYGSRHNIRSLERLKEILQRALQTADDPLEAINGELDHWRETRAADIALEESVRFNNALARTVYVIGGIKLLRWATFGKNCPYCDSLSGSVVGIDENFLNANQDFQPEGAEAPLNPNHNVAHAPAHPGCDCMVVAG